MKFTPEKDRVTLTADELFILESKVLPTAKRWLSIHGLAKHGAKTLAFWGEEFDVPDETRREIYAALNIRDYAEAAA